MWSSRDESKRALKAWLIKQVKAVDSKPKYTPTLDQFIKEHGQEFPVLFDLKREQKKLELLAISATVLFTVLSICMFSIAIAGYRLARVDEIEVASTPVQHRSLVSYNQPTFSPRTGQAVLGF